MVILHQRIIFWRARWQKNKAPWPQNKAKGQHLEGSSLRACVVRYTRHLTVKHGTAYRGCHRSSLNVVPCPRMVKRDTHDLGSLTNRHLPSEIEKVLTGIWNDTGRGSCLRIRNNSSLRDPYHLLPLGRLEIALSRTTYIDSSLYKYIQIVKLNGINETRKD